MGKVGKRKKRARNKAGIGRRAPAYPKGKEGDAAGSGKGGWRIAKAAGGKRRLTKRRGLAAKRREVLKRVRTRAAGFCSK